MPSYDPDPDLPPQQRDELKAFFNTVKSLETIRDVDTSFSAALDQVRNTGGLGAKPVAVIVGSKGDWSIEALRDLFAQQAHLSTNSFIRIIDGATHAGLVDNQTYATGTTAATREVVDAVRTGQHLPAG